MTLPRKQELTLSPWDFDQSLNGWRGVEKKEGSEKAAQLIAGYISQNHDRIVNPNEGEKTISLPLLYFHLGQMLAASGRNKYPEAIEAFHQSFMADRKCWNAYVSATIGFIERDQSQVAEAIQIIEGSKAEDKSSGNLGIVKNFLEALEQGTFDYKTVYGQPRKKGKFAVLLIDMQDFFLDKLSLDRKEFIIANQKKVLNFCAENDVPVISLEYDKRGEITETLKKEMDKLETGWIIKKENNSGFTKTKLEQILKELNIENILLMGINASGCVQDTAIGALKRGFKICTAKTVIASSSKRDRDLATSKKWYSQNGSFFETTESLLDYLKSGI